MRVPKKRLPCCFSHIQKILSGQNKAYSMSTNPIIAKRRVIVFFEKNLSVQRVISSVAQKIRIKNIVTFTDSKLPIPFSIIKDSQSPAKVCENMRGIMKNMERSEYTDRNYKLRMYGIESARGRFSRLSDSMIGIPDKNRTCV